MDLKDKKYKFFDTHCHLFSKQYKTKTLQTILNECKENGVTKLCNVGYDLKTSIKAVIQSHEANNIFSAIGIHPTEVNNISSEDISLLKILTRSNKVIAIGEIGLDYYHQKTSKELQKKWFKKQLELALKVNLPVLLHIRESYADTYEIIKQSGIKKGIVHCFSSNYEFAKKFIDLGFLISFAGNITWNINNDLKETIKQIDLESIVLETDSPYLLPEPLKSKNKKLPSIMRVNYPKNIFLIAKKISDIKNIKIEKIIKYAYNNTKKFLS